MQNTVPRSVVFINGAFISNNCWDEWILFFEKEGYTCIAPPWPYKNASPEELRNRPPDDPIAMNTIASLASYYAGIVRILPQKPILIGHSAGGLVVQLLLQQGLGVAGVAIHSFPPRGVSRFRCSFLRALWKSMTLFTSSHETYLIPFIKWKSTIANGMTCEEQKKSYYRYAVPESKRIIRDVFKCSDKIDFKKPHVPLLLTSGGADKLVPASLNKRNYTKYASEVSITDYKEFKDHSHLVFDNSTWKNEAEFILNWLQGVNK
jgi:pimeloyl-ACP methyl ester carboxylesterase